MKPILWNGDHARLIDQTRLPMEEVWVDIRTHQDAAEAIRSMRIRGAPAIGITAAYGLALAAAASTENDLAALRGSLEEAARVLGATRPTAVNLFWALRRMQRVAAAASDVPELRLRLLQEAHAIAAEDEDMCRRMGRHGSELVPEGARILTHCNAGALATGDYGTALGVIRAAHEQGKKIQVWVDETRPFLQGARLTAWELVKEGIPATLLCDNASGHLMQRGQVDLVVVGSDRITARGDVANKIGTYTLAVLCREHGVPFYVAAPCSTVDLSLESGRDIPIEQRSPEEVTHLFGHPVAAPGVQAFNPAFDVTPAEYVTAIVTEQGVHRPPFGPALRAAVEASLS
ncbi:MAG: S-methyl-5-thioribose-1-phosphate isomerase [Candidatus Eremiobacterota bacterium]